MWKSRGNTENFELLDHSQIMSRSLNPSEKLFREGDPAEAVFFIESGVLRLERRTVDGRLVTVHTGRPGQLFAEASLFSDRYHCDAVAVCPSTVRVYPKAALKQALVEDPRKASHFMMMLAKQVQTLRLRMELRNVRSATDRLLQYLEVVADRSTGIVRLGGPLQDFVVVSGVRFRVP